MIAALIRWSLHNRFFVLLMTLIVSGVGVYSLKETPVDAIPDLSDVQVIIKTTYRPGSPGRRRSGDLSLTTAMLAVPGATTVRGFSFFGDSTSTFCLMRRLTSTGRVAGCWNISVRLRRPAGGCPSAVRTGRHRRYLDLHLCPDRSHG